MTTPTQLFVRQLATLAQTYRPDKSWLPAALASCTSGYWQSESKKYFCFVGSQPPVPGLAPEPDWREQGIWLRHPTEGWLLVDIAVDGSVLGVVFNERARGVIH